MVQIKEGWILRLYTMSWTDVLYPGNSTMKLKLENLSGQMCTHLGNCFKGVNLLIDCIHEYLPGQKFEKIFANFDKVLRDNCNLLIERVNEIKEYLKKNAADLERLIGTDQFQQLYCPDKTFNENIAFAQKVIKTVMGIAIVAVGAILIVSIINEDILTSVVAKLGKLGTCVCCVIVLSAFFLAVDMIVSAIAGKVEKNHLEKALKEYTEAVEEFQPVADKFYDHICMTRTRIEFMNNK